MSRELLWEYTIPNGTQAMWDAYFNTCPAFGHSHYHCSGGGGDMAKDTWTIWIRGTRAKVRRIAWQLDRRFGGTGDLVCLSGNRDTTLDVQPAIPTQES